MAQLTTKLSRLMMGFMLIMSISIKAHDPLTSAFKMPKGNNPLLENKKNDNEAEIKKRVSASMSNRPVKFLENKGQMMDVNNKPVPFVLFRAEAPGMNVYVTEKGLTYVFVKAEEEEHEREREKEKEHKKGILAGPEEEKIKMEMAWVNVNLEGANIQRSNIVKEGQSAEHFNYFYGHCPEGIYDVNQYDKITIKEVYPGIDWVLYNSDKKGMKYDFVLHPGADASQIKLIYEGDKPLKLNDDGSISIKTKLGTLTEAKPYTYEEGNPNEIESNYKLTAINKNKTLLEFNLANYNSNKILVIDPQLNWGTFFGGNDIEEVTVTEVDGTTGDVYIGGYTQSIGTSFPIQNLIGAYNANTLNGTADAYISKFSPTGALLWSTYYGGGSFENLNSLSIDVSGNVFITGSVSGAGFPTFNPFNGAYFQGTYGGGLLDIFIVKFSNIGVRLWATYYGGSSTDSPRDIHCDNMGNLFLVGRTDSPNFPTWFMAGAYNDNTLNGAVDCYIVKFSNIGALQWSTFFGGSNSEFVFSLTTDGGNNLYITGSTGSLPTSFPIVNLGGAYNQAALAGGSTDAYLAKFSNTGNLVWCTYFGGISWETGFSVASDVSNNVYLVGRTDSPNFPIQNLPGAYNQSVYAGGSGDIFIAKFSITGNLDWSTFYGGSGQENFSTSDNLELDARGDVFLTFNTTSTNTPTQPWQAACGGFNDITLNGTLDLFLTHFSSTGALIWATYIGGDGGDVIASVDSYNTNIYIAGCSNNPTSNATYPLANPGGGAYYDPTFNGGQQDVFIMKFTPSPPTYAQRQTNPAGCSGCNGVATISVTCGEAPYTYQWSNAVTVSNSTLTSHSIT
ncbi:MAG: SBBP repeat-containing protein, partial [Bacteroidota bacterium]